MECHFAKTFCVAPINLSDRTLGEKNIWFGGIKFTTGRSSTAKVERNLLRYIFNKLTTVPLIISAINF